MKYPSTDDFLEEFGIEPVEVDPTLALSLYRVKSRCSGLMKPDTHLGENARQIEVSDDQTTPCAFL